MVGSYAWIALSDVATRRGNVAGDADDDEEEEDDGRASVPPPPTPPPPRKNADTDALPSGKTRE